jgi:hypothetical protein
MADYALMSLLGYGPENSPEAPKSETLSTFEMGGLRRLHEYSSPGVRAADAPPKAHVRRHPDFPKYKHQLFGLKDYRPYTDRWLIGYDQPALTDLLDRQDKFYASLSYREMQMLQTYTLFGDRLLNNFLRQTREDIKGLITTMLRNDMETPLDYQIVDRYMGLKSAGLWMPPYEEMFIRNEEFDQLMARIGVSESMRSQFIGMINRIRCREVVMRNQEWFSDFKNIKPMLYDLFTEIMDVILRAPRPRAPIKVYRGMGSERQKSLRFTAMDFWSTSISPKAAMEFARGVTHNNRTLCCIYEITVNPGVPCMFLDPISKVANEMEILMVPSTIYKSAAEVRKKGMYPMKGLDKPIYIYTVELEAVGIDPTSVSYGHLERHWAAQRERRSKVAHKRYKFTVSVGRNPKGARRLSKATSGMKRVTTTGSPTTGRRQTRKVSHRRGAAAGGAGARATASNENRYIPLLEMPENRSESE